VYGVREAIGNEQGVELRISAVPSERRAIACQLAPWKAELLFVGPLAEAAANIGDERRSAAPRGSDFCTKPSPTQENQDSGGIMKRFQNSVNLTELWRISEVRQTKKSTVKSARPLAGRPGFQLAFRIMLAALSLMYPGALPAWAQESSAQGTSEIAKQAQNPIASVISVPLENDFNPHTGIDKEDSYVLEMKPVVPFRLSNDWNLIARTIIPIIQAPDLSPTIHGTSGLGDVQTSLFFSPAKVGKIIWGAGPVISLPTATEDILGTKKVSIGPTAVALSIQGHWLFGTLVQNLFSVAGPSARPDVNQMLMQPFVNYNMRHGWYLTSSPIITSNWQVNSNNRWTVPMGGGVGRIVHFGKLPVNAYTQFFRNVERPDGTTSWSARFQMQFLFPKR
jgi:hypothetical protein